MSDRLPPLTALRAFDAAARHMSFAEAAQLCYQNRISLSATGFYKTPKLAWDRIRGEGRPFYYFAYGAAMSEVAVDTLTGEYRILRSDIIHDVGASLNPAIDVGQIEGGFVQGAGWLTSEELVWDQDGRLRTHAPSTYKIPTCSDRPEEMRMAFVDWSTNIDDSVFRSKAIGEPPLCLAICVLNAMADAVHNVVQRRDFEGLNSPATAENILMSLEQYRAS